MRGRRPQPAARRSGCSARKLLGCVTGPPAQRPPQNCCQSRGQAEARGAPKLGGKGQAPKRPPPGCPLSRFAAQAAAPGHAAITDPSLWWSYARLSLDSGSVVITQAMEGETGLDEAARTTARVRTPLPRSHRLFLEQLKAQGNRSQGGHGPGDGQWPGSGLIRLMPVCSSTH